MTTALIKNDLLYLRPWLAVWGGVLAVIFLLFAAMRTPLGWNPEYWAVFRWAIFAGILIQLLLQLILIAKILQKEHLLDSRAYWRTRPISRSRLPLAKICVILIALLLPQIVQFALAGACFPGGRDGAWHGIRTITVMGFGLSLLGIVSASLTKDVGQAVLALIGIPFLVALIAQFVPIHFGVVAALRRFDYLPVSLVVLGVAGVLWVFWRHYRDSGSRWKQMPRYGGALALLFVGVSAMPVDPVSESTMAPPEDAELTVDDFVFRRTERTLGRETSGSSSSAVWDVTGANHSYGLRAASVWQGLPDDWIAEVRPLRSYGPDGTFLPVEREDWMGREVPNPSVAFQRAMFPGDRISSGRLRNAQRESLFSSARLDPQDVEFPATFRTVFETRFYRGRRTRVELGTGGLEIGSTRFLLRSVKRDGDGLELRGEYVGPGAGGDGFGESTVGGFLVVRNPAKGRVAFGDWVEGSSVNFGSLISSGEVEVRFRDFAVPGDLSELEFYHVRNELVGMHVNTVEYEVAEEE